MGIFKKDANKKGRPTLTGIRASAPSTATKIAPGISVDSFGLVYAEPAAFSTPRPLTAAAAQIKIGDRSEAEYFKSRRASSSSSWQTEAWEYYDAIGEIKYAFNLVASVVSRIRIYAAVVEDPAEAPIPIEKSSK